ncbi:MAG TPA: beta-N-acetylhexosaminidase [Sedimentisphaerales bacterium]|nr:beta-N-acetylhexosaminidase [Sedimentisphaerales bacterium]
MLIRKNAQIVIILIVLTAICPAAERTSELVSVIPQPVSIEYDEGYFQIGPGTRIVAENQAATEASKLIDALAPAMGYRLSLSDASQRRRGSIALELEKDLSKLGDEGYTLRVTPMRILIRAKEPAGLFYGIQTLRQLLPAQVFSKTKAKDADWKVPCVRITDYPRFQWRGLLVDPARHFIPKQDLMRFIDIMALHKFNSLQIHLTDNQGWRIEIKRYPKLTETGAWMDLTAMRRGDGADGSGGKRPGGFYSQEDIRQIVRYAAERNINILPEIEMPAHTGAAIISYPEIGLYPEKLSALPAEKRWAANERVLAPRPRTVTFMQGVLTEVMELFPSRYIHIGGDEANIEHWKQSEEMQALKRELGLKDEAELHSWFIGQMDSFLTRHGRRLVGWDEILQGGLAPGATVMSWRGQQGAITVANAGHDVVMASTSHTYFDYYQGPSDKEPLAIGGDLPLEKVCGFEPIPEGIAPDKAGHVLGVQGQLWGEYISTAEHREYMAYPRAAALAEVGWSPKTARNYENFLARLGRHLNRFDVAGINYRKLD